MSENLRHFIPDTREIRRLRGISGVSEFFINVKYYTAIFYEIFENCQLKTVLNSKILEVVTFWW